MDNRDNWTDSTGRCGTPFTFFEGGEGRDTSYLDIAAELGNLPLTHGAHDGLPHGQLELLANDELHGLATHPAVIQDHTLLVTVQSPVVECGLQATCGIRQGHKLSPSPQGQGQFPACRRHKG